MPLRIHCALIWTLLLTALPVVIWSAYCHAETLPALGISLDYLAGIMGSELIQISKQELGHAEKTFLGFRDVLYALSITAAVLGCISLVRVTVFILVISGELAKIYITYI
jgi:hypothetical protein